VAENTQLTQPLHSTVGGGEKSGVLYLLSAALKICFKKLQKHIENYIFITNTRNKKLVNIYCQAFFNFLPALFLKLRAMRYPLM
jgi:uncharacterized pyridoxamine 5'-phosphate oxidase family protein